MDPKNEEFIALVRSAGWTQAEAARQLGLKPPSISNIFTGETSPSSATLNLLKLKVAGAKGPGVFKLGEDHGGILEPWASDLVADLKRLPVGDRDRILAVLKNLIKAYEGLPSANYPKAKPKR